MFNRKRISDLEVDLSILRGQVSALIAKQQGQDHLVKYATTLSLREKPTTPYQILSGPSHEISVANAVWAIARHLKLDLFVKQGTPAEVVAEPKPEGTISFGEARAQWDKAFAKQARANAKGKRK